MPTPPIALAAEVIDAPPPASVWTVAHVAARAVSRLRPAPPAIGDLIARPRGDHDLQPDPIPPFDEEAARAAAVLVPIVAREGGATVLLTRRAALMTSHAGQIAFPGGKIDAGETPEQAALREAREEIGLDARHVRPLGYLDAYLTGTGFRIVPLVALVEPGFELSLNAIEVDAAFEVPLAFLMDPVNHLRHGRDFKGVWRSFYAMPHGDYYIWGATAGMIRNLFERLAGDPA